MAMPKWLARAATLTTVLAAMAGTAFAQDGISKSTVTVGQSLALTGPGSALAQPFHEGAKLYFDRVNAGGGVNGRKINLVTLDDRGNAALTLANTQKLLDQGVFRCLVFMARRRLRPLIR